MNTDTLQKRHTITANDREQYVTLLLLNHIINEGGQIPIMMQDEYRILEPLIIKLVAKGYLQIPSGSDVYRPTSKGRESLKIFMQRFAEYIQIYDVYCAVDLQDGTFAFENFFNFNTDDEWNNYLNQPNKWTDCRVAVAEFKKINPIEIIFMSFLKNGRFDLSQTGWQTDIFTGLIWKEIQDICNSNFSVDEINNGDNGRMPILIARGQEVIIEHRRREDENRQINQQADEQDSINQQNQNTEEVIEETVVTEYVEEPIFLDNYFQPYNYYTVYNDPFYVSPFWLVPLFLL